MDHANDYLAKRLSEIDDVCARTSGLETVRLLAGPVAEAVIVTADGGIGERA